MPEKKDAFDMEAYLKVSEEAALRTRWITIVMVIATVIIFIGFYNSKETSWAKERLRTLSNFENAVFNNAGFINNSVPEGEPKPLLDPLFQKDDFKNFKKLACNINDDKGKSQLVSKYLRENFNEKTKALLDSECNQSNKNTEPTEELLKAVAGDLNIILKDKFLYSRKRFAGIKLREETEDLLQLRTGEKEPAPNQSPTSETLPKQSPTKSSKTTPTPEPFTKELEALSNLKDIDLIRLNRMLLEDAYNSCNTIKEEKEKICKIDENGDACKEKAKEAEGVCQFGIWHSRNIMPDNDTDRARQFAIWDGHFDNVYFIKIPFWGATIDINDLGIIGGISLIIVLLLMRFSLSREIKNLNVSFEEAFYKIKLPPFYDLLAMRQVLTVPHMKDETKNQFLSVCTKYVCLLPFGALFYGVHYDFQSVTDFNLFGFEAVSGQLYFELFLLLIAFYLAFRCLERQIHIDEVWDDYFELSEFSKDNLSQQTPKTFSLQKLEGMINDKPELVEIINRRLKDTFKKSRFEGNKYAFVEWLGTLWIIKFFTRKNIARLIPGKRLANFVAESSSENVWLAFFLGLFIISVGVYLYIWVFFDNLAGIYFRGSLFFEELRKHVKFESKNAAIVAMVLTAIGVFSAIFKIIEYRKEKRGEKKINPKKTKENPED